MKKSFQCGEININTLEKVLDIPTGQTASKSTASGKGKLFEVSGDRGISVTVAVITWDNGDREVKAISVNGPEEINSLCRDNKVHGGRLRIGIYPYDTHHHFMELRQARIQKNSPNYWATACNATIANLDIGSGMDARYVLRKAGAIEVGTKEKVIEDQGRQRNRMCAVFDAENNMFPVVAFVITRILPLLNKMTAD